MTLRTVLLLATAVAGPLPASDGLDTPPGFEAVLRPALTVEVSAATVGVLASVSAERGDRVSAGQVLAVLESELERADVEVLRSRAESSTAVEMAEVQLGLRRARLEQAERLARDGIVSGEELEDARTEQALAELTLRRAREERRLARLELRRAQARLEQRTVRSPFDGVVLERFLSPGELVDRSKNVRILTLAQLDSLVLDVHLPPSRAASLRRGARTLVELETPAGASVEGLVTIIDPAVDAATGTRRVRVSVPNAEYAIPPGQQCRVRF